MYIHRFLLIFILFQSIHANGQRIFTSTGVLVSTLDDNLNKSAYSGSVIRSSISFGFETKQWHRLSLSTVVSNFTSGGKQPSSSYSNFNNYDHLFFDNYSVGAIGNFYLVNRKTQFYLGIGPRVDYIHSRQAIYTEWDGTGYASQFLRKFLLGVTGSIGINFQLDNFNFGIKSNYYFRQRLYKLAYQGYEYDLGKKSYRVRDNVFDIQLVFGFTLGKKNQEQKPQ